MNQIDDEAPTIRCAICGHALDGDSDDQPFPPLGPMCGECYRSQQMDDDIDLSTSLEDEDDLGL